MGTSVTIYLMRHGKTILNKYQKMQGWCDAPLTEDGEAVAREAAQRLSGVRFDKVYASDLGRTIRTAEIILAGNDYGEGMQVLPRKEFRETFFGSFEGTVNDVAYEAVAKTVGIPASELFKSLTLEEMTDAFKHTDPTGDAESYQEFWDRVEGGLTSVVNDESLPDQANLLIVTHGNTIRHIVHTIDPTINVFQEINNAGVTSLGYEDGTFSVRTFNE
ncbi:MAG: histidine phosphatase family protein [Atopobiaceae bacterium]|jgi:probable phosphoglycerate mutase|nr:histidine phosphatase family protein [Atopobiaceae bacterium]MCH4180501.1 histidine phosphatase family protein [Atopobiaceae bacterium]MCH4214195.1 histidine phosphatase family protein [Atopobiaceae bacterium]MCH4229460.1 histidine phosphatase family protein [Atopobiaceae bacterium]MCH4275861.1 histidine phosphatase family protein [Atopobiaceae bacterium]